jgi:hypothetical protein
MMQTKLSRVLCLNCLLLLLAGVFPAQAFYNPTSGRWLSRDPIGEESFYTQAVRGKSGVERRKLHRESLQPSYGFLGNQSLSAVDHLGLRHVCVVTVRASHFVSGPSGAHDHFNSTDWNAVTPGDSFGYISCGANTLNDAVAARNPCASIPGMPRNQFTLQPTGRDKELADQYGIPYDDLLFAEDVPSHLDAGLEAAKQLAQARCRSRECACCANVRIVITCDPDSTNDDKPYSQGGERKAGRPKCGKSTTLDCKTGNFSMLR